MWRGKAFLLAVAAAGFAVAVYAADDAAPTPEEAPTPEPPPGHAPIQTSNIHTSRDLQKRWDVWYDREMIQPYLAHTPDTTPWKADGQALLQQAITALQVWHGFKAGEEHGKKLLAQGCDDPLVIVLTEYMRCYMLDRTGVVDASKEALARMDSEKVYSPAVVRMAALLTNDEIQLVTNARSPEIDQRIAELTKDSLTGGDYKGDDDYLFLRHVLQWPWAWKGFIDNYEALADALTAAKAPEWIQHTLKGFIEIKRAWDSRGPGFANTVTKKGWMDFGARYQVARDEYTQAWKLHPSNPEAASEMIGVTMTGHGNAGDSMRLWFDRAVAAQFDYIGEYDAMSWGLRPRWVGSVPQMLQFARLCAETRKFDTEVPQQFFKVLEDATQEADWRQVFREPDTAALVVPTALGIAGEPSRGGYRRREYSLTAVEAYLVGDGAASAAALNKAGGQLSGEGKNLLYLREGDVDVMKEEVAVLQTKAGQSFWAGEQLYDKGALDDAIASFRECEDALKAENDPLWSAPDDRVEALEVEKSFAGGGWVKIPLERGCWRFQGGQWDVTPDGAFEIGPGGNAIALTAPCIGSTFQLRGEIEIDLPTKDEATVGILLGEHGTGYYVTCALKQARGTCALRALAMDRWDESTGGPVDVPSQPANTFLIRVEKGKATFSVNGTPVVENYETPSSPLTKDFSRIGIGARNLHPGTKVRVRNLEVRFDGGT